MSYVENYVTATISTFGEKFQIFQSEKCLSSFNSFLKK